MIELLIWLPGILFAITLHEFAHAWMADRLGDPTARLAGRLSLNPVKHIDLIGFIMLFIIHLGWAKPVPVNPYNLSNPQRDTALVSLAGPGSNFLTAFVLGVFLRILKSSIPFGNPVINTIWGILFFTVVISLILAFFNLIPIPPLDGSKVITLFLPYEWKEIYQQIAPYGVFILVGLILVSQLSGLNLFYFIIHLPTRFFTTLFVGPSAFL